MVYDAIIAVNQWLLCSIVDGIKRPCNPNTGVPCDNTNPVNWTSYEPACAMATMLGMHLAFALGKAGKFFLLDLDKCFNNGVWDPIVAQLGALVPGTACEVSHSGVGIHYIGVAAFPVEHGCKNTALHIELYTRDRFIMMGDMANATGNSGAVVDLTMLVRVYFQPGAGRVDVVWSDGPVSHWDGPLDDAELIAAARRSKSKNPFAGRATFEDLWTGNAAVLAGCYPTQNNKDTWDLSSADAALAMHLSFWAVGQWK